LRRAGNDNGCAVAGADAAGAWSAHIRRSREGSDRGYLEEFVEQGRWVIVGRGLEPRPSADPWGWRCLCRESSARSVGSDQRNGSIRAVDEVARSWADNAPFPRDGKLNPPTLYLICRWIASE